MPIIPQDTYDDRCLGLYQGGASVPEIAQWAAKTRPASSSRRHVHAAIDRALRRQRENEMRAA